MPSTSEHFYQRGEGQEDTMRRIKWWAAGQSCSNCTRECERSTMIPLPQFIVISFFRFTQTSFMVHNIKACTISANLH
ncbi:hypothetical protein M378DRAFT_173040 [Amanita muscaria Koide BX008]|uniref:Uncharacterized protein n=1 Tax=Amanita muscaria (strain Koide BX008) TaxID=946122 RepID=A0A0C2SPY6_AMAMK|nr:hypothetical protein M378DRAFT_173040 [Amanita muscaria Koide BX008]